MIADIILRIPGWAVSMAINVTLLTVGVGAGWLLGAEHRGRRQAKISAAKTKEVIMKLPTLPTRGPA